MKSLGLTLFFFHPSLPSFLFKETGGICVEMPPSQLGDLDPLSRGKPDPLLPVSPSLSRFFVRKECVASSSLSQPA